MEITELQKDLAATFRWTARLNMHEGVANHFSACVPGFPQLIFMSIELGFILAKLKLVI